VNNELEMIWKSSCGPIEILSRNLPEENHKKLKVAGTAPEIQTQNFSNNTSSVINSPTGYVPLSPLTDPVSETVQRPTRCSYSEWTTVTPLYSITTVQANKKNKIGQEYKLQARPHSKECPFWINGKIKILTKGSYLL
jgi:hypothetical protein